MMTWLLLMLCEADRPVLKNKKEELINQLFCNTKNSLSELELLHNSVSGFYEDGLYRIYHHSFKVFHLQSVTNKVMDTLKQLLPGRELNEDFLTIVAEGTDKEFCLETNDNCLTEVRPIVEAFLHAKYFLKMAVNCASELHTPPGPMPSKWAALLCLYNLR